MCAILNNKVVIALDNKELLDQLLSVMQQQTDTLLEMMQTQIHESETRINIKIENEVSKRIESLFDGYKLTHEKQWELERETEKLKEQINALQTRIAIIESKISA